MDVGGAGIVERGTGYTGEDLRGGPRGVPSDAKHGGIERAGGRMLGIRANGHVKAVRKAGFEEHGRRPIR